MVKLKNVIDLLTAIVIWKILLEIEILSFRSSSGLERSSRIDYIWCNEMLASKCLSCQIINFEREYIEVILI